MTCLKRATPTTMDPCNCFGVENCKEDRDRFVTVSYEVPAFLERFMRPVEPSMFAEFWRPMHSRYGSTLDVFVEPGRFALVLGAKMGDHPLFKYQIDGLGLLTMDRSLDILMETMKIMYERLQDELVQAGMRHYGVTPS